MRSSQHGLLCPGQHTCYNARYNASRTREGELIAKKRALEVRITEVCNSTA